MNLFSNILVPSIILFVVVYGKYKKIQYGSEYRRFHSQHEV